MASPSPPPHHHASTNKLADAEVNVDFKSQIARDDGIALYYSQLKSLVIKNGASLYGKSCSSGMLMLSAPVLILLLYLVAVLSIRTPPWTHPRIVTSGFECRRFDTSGFVIDEDCYELVYGPTSGLNSSVNTIFEKVIAAAKVTKIRSARTREEFSNILYENQARTGMALWVENLNSYDVFDYKLFSPPDVFVRAYADNGWDQVYDAFNVDGRAMMWQQVVESAAVSVLSGTPFKINATISGFEQGSDQLNLNGVMLLFGMITLLFCGLLVMFLSVHFLMDEKNRNLLRHLRQMGMSSVVCWLSYYVLFFVMLSIPAALVTAELVLFKGSFIEHVPLVYVFLAIWAFLYGCCSWSLFLASFTSKARVADTLVFIVFIVGLLAAVTSPFIFYGGVIHKAIDVYPPIAFAKVWFQFAQFNEPHKTLTWDDFVEDHPQSTSMWYSVKMMFGFSLFVLPLAVYFVLVTDGELTPLFFLNASFWTGKPVKRKAVVDGDSYERAKSQSLENAIVALKMTKTYAGGSTACKEFSIIVPNGVVYSILGPNGAGKTTAISMLTGAIQPTNGAAFAYGAPVDGRPTAYVNASSVCPQDNRLWPELTVIQHMNLVVGMKALMPMIGYVDSLIDVFGLGPYRHVPSRALSGGTQRRLCVAMACLGNPHILFLDEPTTGLDPASRRTVWNVLEKIKETGRTSIILCTHSMEEADALSDNVAIMMDGRLRALGTPMYLKNKFGSGYQVTLIPESDDTHSEKTKQYAEEIAAFARSRLPHAEVELSGSGISQVVSVTIPTVSQALVPVFLKQVHQSRSLLHIKEWGLQHSTLEQAFLRLTSSSKTVNGIVEQEAAASELCGVCKTRICDDVMIYSPGGRMFLTQKVFCSQCAREIIDAKIAEFLSAASASDKPIVHEPVVSTSPKEPYPAQVEMLQLAPPGSAPVSAPSVISPKPGWASSPLDRMYNSFQPTTDLPTLFGQTRAVLMKSFASILKQKKSNRMFVILCIIMAYFAWTSNPSGRVFPCTYITEDLSSDMTSTGEVTCTIADFYGTLWNRQYDTSDYDTTQDCKYLDLSADPKWQVWAVDNNKYRYDMTEREPLPVPVTYSDSKNGAKFAESLSMHISDQVHPHCAGYTKAIVPKFTRVSSVDEANGYITSLADRIKILKDENKKMVDVEQAKADYSTIWCVCCHDVDRIHPAETFEVYYAYRTAVEYANLIKGNFYMDINSLSKHEMTFDIKTFLRKASFIDIDSGCVTAYSSLIYMYEKPPNDTTYGTAVCPVESAYQRIAPGVIVSQMSSAALHWIKNDGRKDTVFLSSFRAIPYDQYVFSHDGQQVGQTYWIEMSTFIIYVPFIFSLIMSMFAYEHNNGLLALGQHMGLRVAPYLVANVAFTLILCYVLLIMMYAVMWLFQVEAMLKANVLLIACAMFAFGITETGIAFILTSFRIRLAVVRAMSYAWAIICLGAAYIMMSTIRVPGIGYYLFPQFLTMRVMLLAFHGAEGQFLGAIPCLAILFVEAVIICAIGLFIRVPRRDKSLKKSTSKSEENVHLLSPADQHIGELSLLNSTMDEEASAHGPVDADVAMEESRTKNSNVGSDMLQVVDLCKTYDGKPPKKALNGVTFGIPKGECFGLLGPNGAGKSTCISVLTASVGASGGLVFADGSVVSGASHEHGVFGICQQDDKLYDDLTTQETLLYYARIKGCNIATERAVAQSAAELIGLDGDAYTQLANTMSGGMKRRLSLACAVIGRPKIVVLDEPTAGLDPETRREVWRAIREVKRSQRCALLLTTHSMEEADSLIAIMTDGRLRCIGTSTHLKGKFGDGYRLSCNAKPETSAQQVIDFVTRVIPGAEIARQAGKSFVFTVSSDESLDMPQLFADMESVEAKSLLAVWSIAMCTLEDVFMAVTTTE